MLKPKLLTLLLFTSIQLYTSVARATPDSEVLPSTTAPTQSEARLPDPARVQQEGWISRDYEDGVVDRMLVSYFGKFRVHPVVSVDVGVSASFFDQSGVSLVGVDGAALFPNGHSELVLGLQQERWPNWGTTESRAAFYWLFHPISTFNISLGAAYRSPQYNDPSLLRSLSWNGPNPELSLLFRTHWQFVSLGRLGVSVLIFNYDRMRLYTPDNIHFTLETTYQLSQDLRVAAMIGTASKGVSGGVVSWGQNTLSLGIHYEP